MQEFLDFAKSHGFDIPSPILDGKIHRFKRNGKGRDNAWYIGFQNFSTASGKKYIYGQVGDWKTGEKWELRPDAQTITAADKSVIEKQFADGRKKEDTEKLERHKAACEKAKRHWDSASSSGTSAYLSKKKLSDLFGARTQLEEDGRTVIVPCRTLDGELHGLQKIKPDGSKKFLYGQRIKGCYFAIGKIEDSLYLCEGFATGVSIHEATGKAVACAFNSTNLLEVAREFRLKFPDLRIIIAGDDDHQNEKNAGRIAAEQAAKACSAAVIFPKANKDETDFNDILVNHGIEELKRQLDVVTEKKELFRPLGFDSESYYFYSDTIRSIIRLSTAMTEGQLLALADLSFWESMFPGKKGAVNWLNARDYLVRLSQAVGHYNPNKVRGSGVWKDSGKIVVNTGKRLICDFKPKNIYIETQNQIPDLHPKPLTVDETKHLKTACENLKWVKPKFGDLLAGWIAIARLAGALPIRPHVWLTGGSGTGKSTVMAKIINPALGHGKIYVQGGSTEAGIRQTVKADAMPLIFDEFETLDDHTKARVQALIELLRQTWSYTDGAVIKGGASGTATQYNLNFAALVSSIRVTLSNDADRSRFSELELAPHGNDLVHWSKMKTVLAEITEDYGERLFARSIKMLPVILKSYEVFADELTGVVSQRFGQQHGMLMAGLYSLYSDDVVTKEVAQGMIQDMDFADDKEEAVIDDSLDCARHLATSRIFVTTMINSERKEMTVSGIITDGCENMVAALKGYGIVVDKNKDVAYIANSHAALKKHVFERTRWADCWKKSLARLPGAEITKPKAFGSDRSRSVKIPLKFIK